MNTKTKKKAPRRPVVRSLTISEQVRINSCNRPLTVPYIRLCGNWLQQLGFTPQKKILVTTMEGLLIIRMDVG